MLPRHPLLALRDRLAKSRVFTISLTFHVILIVVFGGKVVIDQIAENDDGMQSYELVDADTAKLPPAPPVADIPVPKPQDFSPVAEEKPIAVPIIQTPGFDGWVPPPITPQIVKQESIAPATQQSLSPVVMATGLDSSEKQQIAESLRIWNPEGQASSRSLKDRKFAITAFVGRYQAGNWDSTVRVREGRITGGSLPNLLYAMDKWSKGKIDTNERNVRAIALDSEDLINIRPPFIFLTGTKDFKLTNSEIENLRHYIKVGGAVWGDSSVPGRRSAFDNAFRREMQIVLGGDAAKFEPLPKNHSIYTAGYYPKVRQQPAGINNYTESVEVMRWKGEIAILHTRNDYGDMWQIGLDAKGQIDLSRNERGEYIAMDPVLWAHRGVYVRNIEQPAVEEAYRFGINVVIHLVTRWESKVSSAPTL